MRAAPATIGGMPRSSKRAKERQSLTSSRSPCSTCTARAVWPSLKVVNSWARAHGIVELRGMIFSTRPPMVSIPRDSGMTSSSSQSSPAARLPASKFAWMAAPSATTLSGSIFACGVVWKNSLTARCTCGMRVAPPTITTPSTSSASTFASRNAFLMAFMVLPTRCCVMAAKSAAVMRRWISSPEFSLASIVVSGLVDSNSLISRAFTIRMAVSSSDSGASLACSLIQQNRRRSKSSPPRAESPPVDSTSKTPLLSFRMEMSKVPPPRSYTAYTPSEALSRP